MHLHAVLCICTFISDLTVVCAVSSILTFLFGAVGGVIGTTLVVYCAHYKARRGKVDLRAAGPQYENVAAPPAPLYEDVTAPPPATTAAPYEDVVPTQLQLKENVAYGQIVN